MTLVVRAARPDDYERVGDLTIAAYRALPVDHLWGGYDADILDVAGRAKVAEVLVAAIDGRVVGSVTYVDDEESPWLEWTRPGEAQFRLLAVDPAARGQGAGEALAQACIARARAAERDLLIHTTRWMTAAQRLYERLGFVRREDRDVRYDDWVEEGYDLPPEWVGEPFRAYTLSRAASLSRAGSAR